MALPKADTRATVCRGEHVLAERPLHPAGNGHGRAGSTARTGHLGPRSQTGRMDARAVAMPLQRHGRPGGLPRRNVAAGFPTRRMPVRQSLRHTPGECEISSSLDVHQDLSGDTLYSQAFYDYRGLHRFKNKFNPRWEPLYIAYTGWGGLPRTLLAVARACSLRPSAISRALPSLRPRP